MFSINQSIIQLISCLVISDSMKMREAIFPTSDKRGFEDLILLFVAERQRQNQFSRLRFFFRGIKHLHIFA
jgi:hypothetical protein